MTRYIRNLPYSRAYSPDLFFYCYYFYFFVYTYLNILNNKYVSNNYQIITLFSLTTKLVISDELSLIIEKNTNVKDLDTKQIDQLLSLINSWMESLQKEINFIEDIMVGT